jgi:hypothetical protein
MSENSHAFLVLQGCPDAFGAVMARRRPRGKFFCERHVALWDTALSTPMAMQYKTIIVEGVEVRMASSDGVCWQSCDTDPLYGYFRINGVLDEDRGRRH